jgi:hypothetical protein
VVLGTLADFDEELIDIERGPIGVPRIGQHVLPQPVHHGIATLILEKSGAVRKFERVDPP